MFYHFLENYWNYINFKRLTPVLPLKHKFSPVFLLITLFVISLSQKNDFEGFSICNMGGSSSWTCPYHKYHEGTITSIHRECVITDLDIVVAWHENLILWYNDLTKELKTQK